MTDLKAFLDQAVEIDIAPLFNHDERPVLAIDVPLANPGISLDKKSSGNALGTRFPSVLRLVRKLKFPMTEHGIAEFQGLSDLVKRVQLKVDDASPDSVMSVIFFAALQSGVDISDEVWNLWEPAITEWETTGVVENPDSSWPALASALAHTMLGGHGVEQSEKALSAAWARLVPFAIEGLRAGFDPSDIPSSAAGLHLLAARAALDEERARYERKLYAQQIHQLSLPMVESGRRRLVDALFTTEDEFTGTMKVFARNDRKHAPLGRGFSVLILERPDLRETEPHNWLTISLDTRAAVHLLDLWRELEKIETEAWNAAGVVRPERTEASRVLVGAPDEEQRFHEQWYLSPDRSLLASPKRQFTPDVEKTALNTFTGSRISAKQVHDALFRVFDPFDHFRVGKREDAFDQRLIDVPVIEIADNKRVLAAWWPKKDPLPHPAGSAPYGGLFPTAIRAMAARTLGIKSEAAVATAPDIEEIDLVPFGNGLAIVTDGGAYLLDSGRRRPALVSRAIDMVKDQASVAADLDRLQSEIGNKARLQEAELTVRRSTESWLDHQRFCARLGADLIHLRGSTDKPLETEASSLQGLKDALSKRWNIDHRLGTLAAEVEWLERNGRAAEELRVFRIGRWAGGFALAIVVADALADRVAAQIMSIPSHFSDGPLVGIGAASIELGTFGALFLITILFLYFGAWALRSSARDKKKR